MQPLPVTKLISGGQTGADRAALDFAIAHGIPHGGWCPRGRLAEDGTIPWRYRLKQTPSPAYAQRTEWNVRDSDGTAIFSHSPALIGGSKLTEYFAHQYHKPCLHIHTRNAPSAARLLTAFVTDHAIAILNIAGPRASTQADIGDFVQSILQQWWNSATRP